MQSSKITSNTLKYKHMLLCGKTLSRFNNTSINVNVNINVNVIAVRKISTNLKNYNYNVERFVKIVEVGPRDGLQNESKIICTSDKIKLISKLAQAGCPTIEATSFVSPKWVPQFTDAIEVLEHVKNYDPFKEMDDEIDIGSTLRRTTFNSLVPNVHGMKNAIMAGTDEISIFTSASVTFSKKNINCSIDESFTQRFHDVAILSKEYGIPMRGYISCVLGCPYEGDVDVCDVGFVAERLLELGCYEISLADTTGVGTPNCVIDVLDEVQVC